MRAEGRRDGGAASAVRIEGRAHGAGRLHQPNATWTRARGPAGLIAWLALLAGALAALRAMGAGLAPPPLTDPGGMGAWVDGRPPAEASFAVLRLLALGLAWYLLAATVVGTLARLSGAAALVRATDLFTVPSVRRIVSAAAGASITAASFTGSAGMAAAGGNAGSSASADEVVRLSPREDADVAPGSPTTTAERPGNGGGDGFPSPPTLRRLPDEAPSAAAHQTDGTSPARPAPAPPPASAAHQAPARWEVRPGQHFWAVAEAVLATAWQRAPSDAETDRYWRHLVAANRSILRDPSNPDLLYAGQVLTVPPPPPAP